MVDILPLLQKHIICERYRHLDKTVRFGATLISFPTINVETHILFLYGSTERDKRPVGKKFSYCRQVKLCCCVWNTSCETVSGVRDSSPYSLSALNVGRRNLDPDEVNKY